MRTALSVTFAAIAVACGSDTSSDGSGSGSGGVPAQAGAGGLPGTGGALASGGLGLGGGGGLLSGGMPGSGGLATSGGATGNSGGAATGGSATGGSQSGGAAAGSGGSAGSGGAASGGATGAVPEPSAGCGTQGRPAGGTVTVANDHIYTFPESYDGTRPFPLFLGFHACGNPIDQFLSLTKGSKFETEYVRAFPRSSDPGGCWNYGTDISRATRVVDELTSKYCVDLKRVFAAGHSSGAQMIVQILTHAEVARRMRFKAVSPVSASDYGAITGPIPVLYIQGKNDSVRGNDGASAVARFRTANTCDATSGPFSVAGCQSSGKTVNPGCIRYDGCDAPTIWCSHDDPQYGGTSHGVPCFAVSTMHAFFESLP